jgi:putative FmdB family regulatory protein
MPIYTYRREDGTTFELRQKFLDDPLTTCPTTGQPVRRVVHEVGVIFKGSGFYVTDNSKANNPAAKAGAETDKAAAKEDKPAAGDAPAKTGDTDAKPASTGKAKGSEAALAAAS